MYVDIYNVFIFTLSVGTFSALIGTCVGDGIDCLAVQYTFCWQELTKISIFATIIIDSCAKLGI